MFFIKVLKHVLTCYSDDALLRTRLISLSIIVITIVLGPTCTTSVHFNGETESLRLKLCKTYSIVVKTKIVKFKRNTKTCYILKLNGYIFI